MRYKLRLETLSDTIVGSAQAYGTIIDNDIVYDSMGLPYIPAKRIKGIFRNAAEELLAAEGGAKLIGKDLDLNKVFGVMGSNAPEPKIVFTNLQLEDIEDIHHWLKYLQETYPYAINSALVSDHFTDVRAQTAIDPLTGTAKEHSLRSGRVLLRGFCFEGEIELSEASEELKRLFAVLSLYIERMGSKRNRGFGKIRLELMDSQGKSLSAELRQELEEKWNN